MTQRRFKNKIVVVTGAARGIGKNIAGAFGQEGARVMIVDKDLKRARAVCAQFHREKSEAEFLKVDLSKKGAVRSMIHAVVKKTGRLDVLINNASAGQRVSLLEENEQSWEAGMSVTLRAAFFASQEAIKVMAKNGGGCIVNISSVAAFFTCHASPNYHAAKAGITQMTRYLAVQAGPLGVRVNSVSPGFIIKDEDQKRFDGKDNQRYRETAKFCHPLRDVGVSDDVAKAVLFLCSRDARFITGQDLTVDGGLTLQEPSGLVFRFDKELRKI